MSPDRVGECRAYVHVDNLVSSNSDPPEYQLDDLPWGIRVSLWDGRREATDELQDLEGTRAWRRRTGTSAGLA